MTMHLRLFVVFVAVIVVIVLQQLILSQTTVPDSSQRILLLKNGQVIIGEIIADGQTVQVSNVLGITSIPRSDIAVTATTLQEIYRYQSTYVQRNSDAFLKLAEWCVVNNLPEEAAKEYDRAILWANDRTSADTIRNRKDTALSMFDDYRRQREMIEEENGRILQWKEKIPPATFTVFQREVLPLLVHNCNGIACHSGNSLNSFRFLANPSNKDLDVAKNLRVILGYITPGQTDESPLLFIPIAPHGRTKEIFTRQNFRSYEKLYFWTEQVAGEMEAYYPWDVKDRVTEAAENKRSSATPETSDTDFPVIADSSVQSQSQMSYQLGMNTNIWRNPDNNAAQPGVSDITPSQRTDFDFFHQPSVVLPVTSSGGIPRPVGSPGRQLQNEPVVLPRSSTDLYKQNNILQQLQRPPVDPFDPVLFNRQYHYQRMKEEVDRVTGDP